MSELQCSHCQSVACFKCLSQLIAVGVPLQTSASFHIDAIALLSLQIVNCMPCLTLNRIPEIWYQTIMTFFHAIISWEIKSNIDPKLGYISIVYHCRIIESINVSENYHILYHGQGWKHFRHVLWIYYSKRKQKPVQNWSINLSKESICLNLPLYCKNKLFHWLMRNPDSFSFTVFQSTTLP